MFCLVVAAIIGFVAVYVFKMDLRDNETFKTLFVFCVILSLVISISAFYILRKLEVDVYRPKYTLMLGLFTLPIIFVAIWLSPLATWTVKIGLAVIAGIFATANFYSVHYAGKRLRKQLGIMAEEDRREAEREEKARKEKEAKGKSD